MFGRGKHGREDRPQRILIVEDDALTAFDNEHALRDAGFSVVATVDSVAEALRLIEAGGIDLILSDVMLRDGGSGMDVARAAHAAGIALLFASASCPPEAHAYATGYLAKPYSRSDLLGSIRVTARPERGSRPPRGLILFSD